MQSGNIFCLSSQRHMTDSAVRSDRASLRLWRRDAGRKDIKLVGVKVAGKALAADQYDLTDKKLTLINLPAGAFEAEFETEIKPQARGLAQCPSHASRRLIAAISLRPCAAACAACWNAVALMSPCCASCRLCANSVPST